MNFFRLCPSYEMHAPVSNHKPVQCETVFKNMARQTGWGREGAIIQKLKNPGSNQKSLYLHVF